MQIVLQIVRQYTHKPIPLVERDGVSVLSTGDSFELAARAMKFVKFTLQALFGRLSTRGAPISISRWVHAVSKPFLFFSLTPGDLLRRERLEHLPVRADMPTESMQLVQR